MKELADRAGSVESSMVKADKHPKHMRACLQAGKIPAEITEWAMVAASCPPACTLACDAVCQSLLRSVWVTVLASGVNRFSRPSQNHDSHLLSSMQRIQKKIAQHCPKCKFAAQNSVSNRQVCDRFSFQDSAYRVAIVLKHSESLFCPVIFY